jgi:hypothetical protein
MPANDLLGCFSAYAGSCSIAIAAYNNDWNGNWKIIAAFCVYAAVLQYLQGFVQRDPDVQDFAASALGAASGGAAGAFLWPRVLQLSPPSRRLRARSETL